MALACALLLGACAAPAQRIDARAAEHGYERLVVPGADFEHVVYRNHRHRRGSPLHVYIEGDGRPWVARYWVASDPTSAEVPMLELMAMDAAPALYLGRPCYLGHAADSGCGYLAWTHERYSARVVDSMVAALARLMPGEPRRGVVLIGHSGGGTLAMLLAARVPDVRAVVTLAGNLDTEAWTTLHHYSPLTGSLNPARAPPLDARILQLHLAGERDRNVPPALIRSALPDAVELRVIPGFTHGCCWQRIWPQLLDEIEARVGGLPRRVSGAAAN